MTYPDVFPHDLEPGLTIPLRSFADLRGFEEELVHIVDERYNEQLWNKRVPLTDLVRPHRSQGDFESVSLTVMDEPFEKFLAAQAAAKREPATVKFNRGDGKTAHPRRNYLRDLCAPLMRNFVGFHFLAEAKSGDKTLGPVSADIWFGPLVAERKRRETYVTEGVVRIVTLPSYDADAFTDRLKASKEKGRHNRQGLAGKTFTRGSGIDPRN
jgi:hypothetical protein